MKTKSMSVAAMLAAGVLMSGTALAQQGTGSTTAPRAGGALSVPDQAQRESNAPSLGLDPQQQRQMNQQRPVQQGQQAPAQQRPMTPQEQQRMQQQGQQQRPMMQGQQYSSAQVRQAQQALNQRGFPVREDGRWGPQTTSAVRQFQQSQGLQPTGQLNQQTAQALGIGGGAQVGEMPPAQGGAAAPTRSPNSSLPGVVDPMNPSRDMTGSPRAPSGTR